MEVILINYKLLYDKDVFDVDLKELIATNRGLPADWCSRKFSQPPSLEFSGMQSASNIFLQHLKLAESNSNQSFPQKFQIVVDSDLDGICSAAILFLFLKEFFPHIETTYLMHKAKQHGLSNDIKIDDDTTLVFLPDAGSNDIEQCRNLRNKYIDVICLDHHIIEQVNPYASIINCMDEVYPNPCLCGAAVTWLFLFGFSSDNLCQFLDSCRYSDKYLDFLLTLQDLVAVATISDIMEIKNEDNMYFVQNGLNHIHSNALKAFLLSSEVNLGDVTIEDIKFKVSPLISAMIRVGSEEEKDLLFRAFIDDYEEFDYEKRGSLGLETEVIYDKVVRLCRNAKSRQDRAKQKMLNECQVHEFQHIIFVEYQSNSPSALTGLVANEFANQYCKPCVVYRSEYPWPDDPDKKLWFSGSARNYDGSPINNLKQLISEAFGDAAKCGGHANAFGIQMEMENAAAYGRCVESYIDSMPFAEAGNTSVMPVGQVGEKVFQPDFFIGADDLDGGFIQKLHWFEHYSGFGFAPVSALVTGIKVTQNNFKTMGKNTFNWKIYDEDNGVTYIKFKVDRENDELIEKFDDLPLGIDFVDFDFGFDDSTVDTDMCYVLNAICTFGLNIYKGEIHPQAVIKDYQITDAYPVSRIMR